MKKKTLPALLLTSALLLSGCGNQADTVAGKGTDNSGTDSGISITDTQPALDAVLDSVKDMFSDRDFEVGYNESESALILMSGNSASCTSNAVEISDTTITIKDEGTYIVSGTLDNGMIIVDADEKDKIQLVLNGVSITNETSAALYIPEADKVFVTLPDGTENTLTNGGTYTAIDDNNIDGAVFSKQDLTFNGSGSLTVNAVAGHGIVCKDDLVFTSGNYTINSAEHGFDVNDSIRIANASICIASGKDGMHAEHDEDETLGYIYIASGDFDISAEGDGISAGAYMLLEDGIFAIDSADDSLHSNTSITIYGGSFEIASGDDGIHADETLAILNGTLNITDSYEGLEALTVDISGGDISLYASDDGINAAGGTDQSGYGGMRGNDRFGGDGSSNGQINISGGTLYLNASGDGIDANGSLAITGGHIIVSGPTSGDTAVLDYDNTATITDATFIGTGSSMMAQTLTSTTQGVIAVTAGGQSAGITVTLTDNKGNIILTHETDQNCNLVILSSPDIVKGESYSLTVGSVSGTVTAN